MNVTNVNGSGDLQQSKVATVAIKPGMMIERVGANGVRPNTAAGVRGSLIFAENSADLQIMRDGAYDIGDTVMFHMYEPGELVNAILKSGEAVSAGDELVSSGDGYLKAVDGSVAAHLATGTGGGNNGLTFTAVNAGVSGNNIAVTMINPLANDQPLLIDVEGSVIKIYLKTGSGGAIESTAAQVLTAVNADDVAKLMVLVTAISPSNGSAAVAAVAVTELAGGVDTDVCEGYAVEAVNATSAAADCVIRIK